MSRDMTEGLRFCHGGDECASSVLDFTAVNDFTPRSLESWHGENMDAVLAFQSNELVGSIPFASRKICSSGSAIIQCGYLSGVAVAQQYRNKGLGSQLLHYLTHSTSLDGIMVNSAPDDLAYRWYVRNGFNRVLEINRVVCRQRKGIDALKNTVEQIRITNTELSDAMSAHLLLLFEQQYKHNVGFEVRDITFWNRRLKYHFYKAFNDYYLLLSHDHSGYAIVSINTHPTTSGQIDILEICFQSKETLKALLNQTHELASQRKLAIIQCAVVKKSILDMYLISEGFEKQGQFDMLYYPIQKKMFEITKGAFFLYDYA